MADDGSGPRNAAGRVTILEFPGGQVLFDEVIRPAGNIINLLTPVSGINSQDMHSARYTLGDVHDFCDRNFGPNTIVIGHAVVNDFKYLQRVPPRHTLDTALLYDHPEVPGAMPSLAWCTKTFLNRDLDRAGGHSSLDDCKATMGLISYLLKNGEFA